MADPSRPLVRVLICAQCDEAWWDPRDRWRIYFTDDDPPSPIVYCEDCAERELTSGGEMAWGRAQGRLRRAPAISIRTVPAELP